MTHYKTSYFPTYYSTYKVFHTNEIEHKSVLDSPSEYQEMNINPQPINLIDTEELLVSVIPRDSHTVTLCFTGVGNAIGGIDIQSFEFLSCSKNSTTIFIVDRKRSWGNQINFDGFINSITKYIEGKTINTIGNSMGGFLAILVTRFIPVSSCVAFVPQYSVSKRIVPNENRFDKYVDKILEWRYESLFGFFNKKTSYYIFFGSDNAIEDEHRKLFPVQKNIHLFLFTENMWAHRVAKKLKEYQILYPTIKSCFELASPNEIISKNLAGYGASIISSHRSGPPQ